MRPSFWPLALVLVAAEIPILLLRFADHGDFGNKVIARISLNLAMLFVGAMVLRSIRLPAPAPLRESWIVPRWASFVAWAALVVLIALLMNREIPSKISGQVYSKLELWEVLVTGPLSEEVFFRCAVWLLLARFVTGPERPLRCWLVTSVIFSSYHLGFWSDGITAATLVHLASALIGGLVFGFVRLKTNRLVWPVWLHGFTNAFLLSLRVLGSA